MEVKLETLFKIIGAVGTVFIIGLALYRGYRDHDRKLTKHTEVLSEHEEEIKEMKEGNKERFDKLEKQIAEWRAEEKASYEVIRSNQEKQGIVMARIDGFISGSQKSQNK